MSKIIAFLFQMKCPECNGFLEIYMLDMVFDKLVYRCKKCDEKFI